jgi:uncharacterized Ntn-hydrolase superfamily protein
LIDLRVDDADDPIAELRRLWKAFEPQIDQFQRWATDPGRA